MGVRHKRSGCVQSAASEGGEGRTSAQADSVRERSKRRSMDGTHLKERVPSDDGEEALEALAAALDDLVREAVREDLAGQRGDVHARALALEDVTEGFEVRVPSSDDRVPEFERGDVRLPGRGLRRE